MLTYTLTCAFAALQGLFSNSVSLTKVELFSVMSPTLN